MLPLEVDDDACDADGGDRLAVEVTVIGTQLAQQDADRLNAMIADVELSHHCARAMFWSEGFGQRCSLFH